MRRPWHRPLLWFLVMLVVIVVPIWAGAQGQGPEGFVQMSPEDMRARENLPAAPFVFAAYAFVWVALVAYVFILWRKLGRVEQELADVSARLRSGTQD